MTKKILILGGTGMLGHVLLRYLSTKPEYDVYATARNLYGISNCFPEKVKAKIRCDVDADNFDTIIRGLAAIQPHIVINCIGLIKQNPIANDPLSAITINAQLPHRLSLICNTAGVRLVHISTDCVFNGQKGSYKEEDVSDAQDIYGRTKYLGEIDYPHCVTLRTSIIGHELKSKLGLIEWFLAQKNSARGYTRAIYSGFPTIELAEIIGKYVLPNDNIQGIYHVSSRPISKYDLLKMVAKKYNKSIKIEPYDDFIMDRSLDSTLFSAKTGYSSPAWDELIDKMNKDYIMHREGYYANN
jgi:dTDP-4-dehydrorhamnose reductase